MAQALIEPAHHLRVAHRGPGWDERLHLAQAVARLGEVERRRDERQEDAHHPAVVGRGRYRDQEKGGNQLSTRERVPGVPKEVVHQKQQEDGANGGDRRHTLADEDAHRLQLRLADPEASQKRDNQADQNGTSRDRPTRARLRLRDLLLFLSQGCHADGSPSRW